MARSSPLVVVGVSEASQLLLLKKNPAFLWHGNLLYAIIKFLSSLPRAP